MTLAERRVQLVSDMQAAATQRDRLHAAATDAATQVERMLGALAMLDELIGAESTTGSATAAPVPTPVA